MRIMVLSATRGDTQGENALRAWYEEMKNAALKSALLGELPQSKWERIGITPRTDIKSIAPKIARADAIIFLAYSQPQTNLDTFITQVGRYAKRPNKLPGCAIGFVFVGEEDPHHRYYFNDLFAHCRKMEMDLSPGLVWMKKLSSRAHEKFALRLVEQLAAKAAAAETLEPI